MWIHQMRQHNDILQRQRQSRLATNTWLAQIETIRWQSCAARRHYKWPRRLLVKFFMWATYNAYVLHDSQAPHNKPGRRRRYFTFHTFISQLCHELVDVYRCPVTPTPYLRRNSVDSAADDIRQLNQEPDPQYLVEKQSTSRNHRCVVCTEKYNRVKRQHSGFSYADLPKRYKTVYKCSTCTVFLCVGNSNENCFKQYHTAAEYWR